MPDAITLTTGMMAVLAPYEREVISERTKAVLAAAKRRGVKLGNPRLHTLCNSDTDKARRAKQKIACERTIQLRAIIAVIESDLSKPLSLAEIAAALNTSGYSTARGKQFTKAQVRRKKFQHP